MEGWVKLYRKTKDHWLWGSERRLKWSINRTFKELKREKRYHRI